MNLKGINDNFNEILCQKEDKNLNIQARTGPNKEKIHFVWKIYVSDLKDLANKNR